MSEATPVTLTPPNAAWAARLAERMGGTAPPPAQQVIGPIALLATRSPIPLG